MIVQFNGDKNYPDLTSGQYYIVLGIEADDYRILNDSGYPYLYPPELFKTIDPSEPSDWVIETGEDGEKYAYPPLLNTTGFFEDFFDRKKDTVTTFWHIVNQKLIAAAKAA